MNDMIIMLVVVIGGLLVADLVQKVIDRVADILELKYKVQLAQIDNNTVQSMIDSYRVMVIEARDAILEAHRKRAEAVMSMEKVDDGSNKA